MKRDRKPATLDRPKEILVVLQPDAEGPQPPRRWSPVFGVLAKNWRIFWVRAPMRGERIPSGGAGFDAVSQDTMPAIRRVLSEHVISTVFLIGGEAVESCLEPLHSFASHIPYCAVIDEPWPGRREGRPTTEDRLEFTLGLADRVLLSDESHRAALEPLLRRLPAPAELIPDPRRMREFSRFCAALSRSIGRSFQEAQAALVDKTPPSFVGLLPDDAARAERLLEEWRRCLPAVDEWWLLPGVRLPAGHARRLERRWPRARWLRPRDEQHRVELINRALRGSTREFALVLSESARVQPLFLERLLACGRKLPLVGAVGPNRSPEAAPSDWREWASFASAWALRFNGSYRSASHVSEECFLVRRAAFDAVGLFDPRLGWRLAARDYCLRLRQAGLHLFVAEDALIDGAAPADSNASPFSDAFVRKWNLDPLAILPPKKAG